MGSKKIHFIAIGGHVMYALAIALKNQGYTITGSDDEIYEPYLSSLKKHNLHPVASGWFPEKLNTSYEAVIVDTGTKKDNPELIRAQQLGIPIYSFPDFIYEHSKDKQRIVIAGSHGKTTITAIIIHVLQFHQRKFDYVVEGTIRGIENTVALSDAPVIVIEGDEHLASPLDQTPKFIRYKHHIGVINGITWDNANVFSTEEEYVKQFDLFADQTPKGGILLYFEQDTISTIVGKKERADVLAIPYKGHSHTEEHHKFYLTNGKEKHPIKLFGTHNLQNLSAAKELLKKIGITPEMFFEAIGSFEGTLGCLQRIKENNHTAIYIDCSHTPSKIKTTIRALKELYPERTTFVCLELYSHRALSKHYLSQYKDSLKQAQGAVVYYNPEKTKVLDSPEFNIKEAFSHTTLQVFTDISSLSDFIKKQNFENKNLLLISSGNFGGIDLSMLSSALIP